MALRGWYLGVADGPDTALVAWLPVLDAVGSFLSGVGLIAAAVSVVLLVKATRASERAATAAVYQSIVAIGSAVSDVMIAHADIARALFEPLASADTPSSAEDVLRDRRDRPGLFFAAIKWLDYFETVFVNWDAIPADLQRAWATSIVQQLAASAYLRTIVEGTDWYAADLKDAAQIASGGAPPERHGMPPGRIVRALAAATVQPESALTGREGTRSG